MPEEVNSQNGSGTVDGLKSALTSKELLIPAALSAAGAVVAAKGPDLMHRLSDSAEEKTEDAAEGLGQKAADGAKRSLTGGGGMLSKMLPGGGGGSGSGSGSGGKKTRRLPIQRWTDVTVPVDKAYQAWTDFDKYPTFMHRVLNVERKERDVVSWEEKIWFSKRQWEGKITERRKNDRIAWKTESGTNHTGIVSFHKLDEKLTRVLVTVDFQPTGMMEKMASGLRFVKRAVQADLARFKAYVELEDAEGVEYESVPEKADDKDEKKQDDQGNERRQSSSSNGNGSDEERESDRKEREERRKERREALSSS